MDAPTRPTTIADLLPGDMYIYEHDFDRVVNPSGKIELLLYFGRDEALNQSTVMIQTGKLVKFIVDQDTIVIKI